MSHRHPPPEHPRNPRLRGFLPPVLKYRRSRGAVSGPENNLSVLARLTGFAIATPHGKASNHAA
ncbi:hypothetical protein HMPREF9080_01511 [Cardiobacterium valvarum F0432]|uniref:Uncharacterized protein n=1 Tax=Cardiobacterium valvarum F0432 TaxID=797473 RepID=G9ZFG6_9GAMM|nr:hypothetical protein HMPREF9080_01511 [Cardiobacterium valvarum F0432]